MACPVSIVVTSSRSHMDLQSISSYFHLNQEITEPGHSDSGGNRQETPIVAVREVVKKSVRILYTCFPGLIAGNGGKRPYRDLNFLRLHSNADADRK